jgi:hypothetical protein
MNERSMKDDLAQALVDAPGHLIRYVGGLIVLLLGDYVIITLAIFSVLLGFAVGSALIGATAFYAGFFLLRLVGNIADAIGYLGQGVGSGLHRQADVAQAQLQSQMQPPAPTDPISETHGLL